ncbi:MAG: 4-hydroxy-tetrahydrodipicolinate reductase [Oscillospiraceae bacterium]|nr:4-hydroxy-tetrahydrodipicolinate reductase [Oscillospiraceae bacterium]
MTRIILSGAFGKMGKAITSCVGSREDCEIAVGVDVATGNSDFPLYHSFKEISEDVTADVIVDFSHPSALNDLLEYAISKKLPAVIATTGLNNQQIPLIKAASESIPVFFSANMSVGVSLISELAKKAAKILQNDFDIEIVEMHHNQKIDAPSGTALMLADSISEVLNDEPFYEFDRHSKRMKRNKNEIGIHSVRGGTVVGEHEIIFAGNDEVIKISHSAFSKQLFAVGAVNAGIFLVGKEPGFYSMKDLINSI